MRRLFVSLLIMLGLISLLPFSTPARAATILSGQVSLPSLVIPAGEVFEFDPRVSTTVEVSGNVIVYGTLRMQPSNPGVQHVLRFVGIDESRYVGGGDPVLASDVGLWVEGRGRLDLRGTPRKGWNRTGRHPTWRSGDEIRVTPTAVGDFSTFRRFTPGKPVPVVTSPTGRQYRAEVFNLTRNVSIEGTPGGRAHVRVNSTVPQRVRWAQFRYLGPNKFGKPVAGRTGLHFHRNDDGSRGTLVQGVVLRDIAGETALDIHRSHGITVRDSVVFNADNDGIGWTVTRGVEPTNDTSLVHDLVVGLDGPQDRVRQTAFLLADGKGNSIRRSAAAGVAGGKDSSGFHWPEGSDASWDTRGLLSHNNVADGVFVWQNSGNENNVLSRITAYRNGGAGIDHGAYSNTYRYIAADLFENQNCGLVLHAKSKPRPYRSLAFVGGRLGSVCMPAHNREGFRPALIKNARVTSLTIDELSTKQAGRYDLVDTGLRRSGVRVVNIHPQSRYRVQNGSTAWQVTAQGITRIPAFR